MNPKIIEFATSLGIISRHFKRNMFLSQMNIDHSAKDCRTIEFLEEGKKTMSEIAKELNLTAGAATTYIDKLIESNLIEREYDKNDRRKIYIKLSKEGKKINQYFKKKYLEISLDLLKPLTENEQEEFIRLCKKTAQKLL